MSLGRGIRIQGQSAADRQQHALTGDKAEMPLGFCSSWGETGAAIGREGEDRGQRAALRKADLGRTGRPVILQMPVPSARSSQLRKGPSKLPVPTSIRVFPEEQAEARDGGGAFPRHQMKKGSQDLLRVYGEPVTKPRACKYND